MSDIVIGIEQHELKHQASAWMEINGDGAATYYVSEQYDKEQGAVEVSRDVYLDALATIRESNASERFQHWKDTVEYPSDSPDSAIGRLITALNSIG